jgi:hypothetical protein
VKKNEMHWGRVVAGIYCLGIVVLALLQIGNLDINLNISVGNAVDTSAPSLAALVNGTTTGSAVSGATIAGLVFGIVGTFAFVPALLLMLNFASDAPEGDDGLVPARVLVWFRVLLILSGGFWGTLIASFLSFGPQVVGGVFIPDLVVAAVVALLGQIVGWFAFRRAPLVGKVVRTNKLVALAFFFSLFGFAGVIAGVAIQTGGSDILEITWAPVLFLVMYFFQSLTVPLWLKFRNDHGGMLKSHAVVGVLGVLASVIATATQFGSALDFVVSNSGGIGGTRIAYCAGYGSFMVAHILCLVGIARQRRAAVNGYAPLQENGVPQQPSAPLMPPSSYYPQQQQPKVRTAIVSLFSHTAKDVGEQQPYVYAAPSQQGGYMAPPPSGAPRYQEPYQFQYGAPQPVAYPPQNVQTRPGDFEYDKPRV